MRSVVAVDRLRVGRMMPMVEMRGRKEIFEGTESKARIGVNQDGLDAYPHDVGIDRGLGKSQEVDREDHGRPREEHLREMHA